MKKIISFALCVLSTNLGYGAATAKDIVNIDAIKEVQSIIKDRGIREPNYQKITEIALRSLCSIDEYSMFINTEESALLKTSGTDSFIGIGISIDMHKGKFIIADVIDHSPANEIGLKKKDQLLAVNGLDIKHETLIKIIEMMKGDFDEPIELKVKRGNKVLDFSTKRAIINVNSVDSYELKDFLVIKIKTFHKKTASEVEHILKTSSKFYKNIILDLRDNSGGFLDSAVEISNLFLQKDQIITKLVDRNQNVIKLFIADGKRDEIGTNNKNVYVLINQYSISSSEVLASSLQDNKVAKLYGTKSFGKASVQEFIQLESMDAIIKITTSEYRTPLGKRIAKIGIEPDVKINLNKSNYTDIISFINKHQ